MVRRIGRFCEVMFEDERWARDDVSRERLMRRRCGGEVVENKEMIRVSLRSQFPSKKFLQGVTPNLTLARGATHHKQKWCGMRGEEHGWMIGGVVGGGFDRRVGGEVAVGGRVARWGSGILRSIEEAQPCANEVEEGPSPAQTRLKRGRAPRKQSRRGAKPRGNKVEEGPSPAQQG